MRATLYGSDLRDKFSKIPLPIEPRQRLPDIPRDVLNVRREVDRHHPADNKAKLLAGSLGDKAMRFSRIQWALYDDHHSGVHANRLSPVLPTDIRGQFRYVLFMDALYLPDDCIGFSRLRSGSLEPRRRDLNVRQRQMMWERGDIEVDTQMPVTRFLLKAAIGFGIQALGTRFDNDIKNKFRAAPQEYALPFMNRLAELAMVETGMNVDYMKAKCSRNLPHDSAKNAKAHLVGRVRDYETARLQAAETQEYPGVVAMIQTALGSSMDEAA